MGFPAIIGVISIMRKNTELCEYIDLLLKTTSFFVRFYLRYFFYLRAYSVVFYRKLLSFDIPDSMPEMMYISKVVGNIAQEPGEV